MAGKYNGMKYARDWVGKSVVLARDICTGAAKHPAGLRGVIVSQSSRGLDFEREPCPCCGVQPRITRLGYYDVNLAPNIAGCGNNPPDQQARGASAHV